MQSLKEKRLELFDKEFPYRTRDTQELIEKRKIKKYLSDSIDMAYEEGKKESCTHKNEINGFVGDEGEAYQLIYSWKGEEYKSVDL